MYVPGAASSPHAVTVPGSRNIQPWRHLQRGEKEPHNIKNVETTMSNFSHYPTIISKIFSIFKGKIPEKYGDKCLKIKVFVELGDTSAFYCGSRLPPSFGVVEVETGSSACLLDDLLWASGCL